MASAMALTVDQAPELPAISRCHRIASDSVNLQRRRPGPHLVLPRRVRPGLRAMANPMLAKPRLPFAAAERAVSVSPPNA
jgi:hypothetical protein